MTCRLLALLPFLCDITFEEKHRSNWLDTFCHRTRTHPHNSVFPVGSGWLIFFFSLKCFAFQITGRNCRRCCASEDRNGSPIVCLMICVRLCAFVRHANGLESCKAKTQIKSFSLHQHLVTLQPIRMWKPGKFQNQLNGSQMVPQTVFFFLN